MISVDKRFWVWYIMTNEYLSVAKGGMGEYPAAFLQKNTVRVRRARSKKMKTNKCKTASRLLATVMALAVAAIAVYATLFAVPRVHANGDSGIYYFCDGKVPTISTDELDYEFICMDYPINDTLDDIVLGYITEMGLEEGAIILELYWHYNFAVVSSLVGDLLDMGFKVILISPHTDYATITGYDFTYIVGNFDPLCRFFERSIYDIAESYSTGASISPWDITDACILIDAQFVDLDRGYGYDGQLNVEMLILETMFGSLIDVFSENGEYDLYDIRDMLSTRNIRLLVNDGGSDKSIDSTEFWDLTACWYGIEDTYIIADYEDLTEAMPNMNVRDVYALGQYRCKPKFWSMLTNIQDKMKEKENIDFIPYLYIVDEPEYGEGGLLVKDFDPRDHIENKEDILELLQEALMY